MDEKLLKLNIGLAKILKGLVYAAGLVVVVVSVLGYVYSYSEIKIWLQNEDVIPKLIFTMVFITVFFIGWIGVFIFIICGKKFNLKNAMTIILEVPMLLLVCAGYLLSTEYFTAAYDISIPILSALAITFALLAGMKFILWMFREYKLVKEDTRETEKFNDKTVD